VYTKLQNKKVKLCFLISYSIKFVDIFPAYIPPKCTKSYNFEKNLLVKTSMYDSALQ